MRKFLLLALLCPFLSMCQPLSIKGKIINEQSEPIAGATITVKCTNPPLQTRDQNPETRLSSNASGEFTISNIHYFDTLVVTAVGYEPAKELIDPTLRGKILVILKRKITALEEVVINTGYQSIPKERATGSFTQLSNSLLVQQQSTDILGRLEGIANGVYLDRKTKATGQFMVRGLSTISGPRDPLIILNNFPYEGNLNNINPADVESITILKDAAAASIWGARAGNGVIVITTKKAKYNQPLRISINAGMQCITPPDLFALPLMSSADFIGVESFLFGKGYRFSDTANTSRPLFSPVYEILFNQRAGRITAADAAAQIERYKAHDVRNDFNSYVYRPGFNQQYALNLQGGSAINNWLFSAGFDKNMGVTDDLYRRTTLRTENNIRLTKNFDCSAALYYVQSTTNNGLPGYGSISNAKGSIPLYTFLLNEGGNSVALAKNYRLTYTDTAGAGKLLNWNYYPLEEARGTDNTTRINELVADFALSYKLGKGLSLSFKYRFQNQRTTSTALYSEQTYFVRDLVNRFTQLNRTTGAVTYKIPLGAILDKSAAERMVHNGRVELAYNKSYGMHGVTFFAGAELKQLHDDANTVRTYGYNNDILTFSNVDYANAYPSFISGTLAFIPNPADFSDKTNRFVSCFANAAYTLKERYTLSLSTRKDASNLFGLNTNQKWNPLWSAGLSWDLSAEPFYHNKTLGLLRLRATYGYSGNIDPSATAVTTIGYNGTSPYTGTPTARIDKFVNPDLRWEKMRMINLGLDFRTTQQKLWGSIECFFKKSTDLFSTVPIDITTGLAALSIRKNAAATKGFGFDVDLNLQNKLGPVQWIVNTSVNGYWDKVTDFYLASTNGSQFVGEGTTGIIGRSIYSVFAYQWAGLNASTGDPMGYNNGQPSKDYTLLTGTATTYNDLVYKGRGLPPVYTYVGNTFQWKGFELTARLIGKFGYWFRRSSVNYTNLFASSIGHSDYALRWQQPGDEQRTNVPSMIYPADSRRDAFYTGSEVLVTKGDHIRLQYINLAYNCIPAKMMKQLRLSVTVNNLGILWRANDYGLDPDYYRSTLLPAPAISFSLAATF